MSLKKGDYVKHRWHNEQWIWRILAVDLKAENGPRCQLEPAFAAAEIFGDLVIWRGYSDLLPVADMEVLAWAARDGIDDRRGG